MNQTLTSLELCAGAGGQALGLEKAGFKHLGLIENDEAACNTLRLNRPDWNVIEHDLFQPLDYSAFNGIDLLAGGLPCPPFSIAGKQLGPEDERNLFDVGISIVENILPKAIMFENVRGMLGKNFDDYRNQIASRLAQSGYMTEWKLLQASDFGVPQLRPRAIMVAMSRENFANFVWPKPHNEAPTVADALFDLMSSRGWEHADEWRRRANRIAPTLVGGSKKHGGPDLGPTRARAAWAELGVNGKSLADIPPGPNDEPVPRLTVRMAARIQGFPDEWGIWGRKTAAYRQVGNAFPPPMAMAVALQIRVALLADSQFAMSA